MFLHETSDLVVAQSQHGRRWLKGPRAQAGNNGGIGLTMTAVGIAIAGMLISVTGILAFAVDMAGVGLGLILAQVWSARDVENLPKAAL